jgi:hypothetical protein
LRRYTSVLIQDGVGLCANPNVTVDDVELTCTVSKGRPVQVDPAKPTLNAPGIKGFDTKI